MECQRLITFACNVEVHAVTVINNLSNIYDLDGEISAISQTQTIPL